MTTNELKNKLQDISKKDFINSLINENFITTRPTVTLRQHIAHLIILADTHPQALDLEIITSTDDEGNFYNKVYYQPTLGHFDTNEFYPIKSKKDINAVCLN